MVWNIPRYVTVDVRELLGSGLNAHSPNELLLAVTFEAAAVLFRKKGFQDG